MTIPNTQIPHIGDYVRIVSAICNKFRPDFSTGIEEKDVAMAAKMRFLANGVNELKDTSIKESDSSVSKCILM